MYVTVEMHILVNLN